MRPFLYHLSLPPSPSPPCPSPPPFSTRPSRPFWLTSQTQMNSNRIEMIRFRVSFGLSGSDSPLTKTATKSEGLSTCESFDPSSVVRLRFRLSGAGGQPWWHVAAKGTHIWIGSIERGRHPSARKSVPRIFLPLTLHHCPRGPSYNPGFQFPIESWLHYRLRPRPHTLTVRLKEGNPSEPRHSRKQGFPADLCYGTARSSPMVNAFKTSRK